MIVVYVLVTMLIKIVMLTVLEQLLKILVENVQVVIVVI